MWNEDRKLTSSESHLLGLTPVTVKTILRQAGTWEVVVRRKEVCLSCTRRQNTSVPTTTNIKVTSLMHEETKHLSSNHNKH
jgi:hypothetical protein